MTSTTMAPVSSAQPLARFAITIFIGSFLLFLVQPLVARLALPRLGGAPAVWNSAMLVYQALLLAGYAYAYVLGNLAPRKQASIHLGVFALAALALPIGLVDLALPPRASPVIWVPWLLLISIGPLFFAVSAQAPLLQRWFALTTKSDPYRLYAASNLGSFGGLLAYPLIVEPLIRVGTQRWLWSAAYLTLAGLVVLCALAVPAVRPAPGPIEVSQPRKPDARTILFWCLVAAVPSGLILSTTLHITTDVVAMPLLWVVPLGVYLLSFSIAFGASDSVIRPILWLAPIVLLLHAASLFVLIPRSELFAAGLAVFSLFVVSVSLHKRIYDRRPPVEHLTTFYLALAAGGVLGGLFCAVIAPLVFDWTYEHPLLLVAAALLMKASSPFKRLIDLWDGDQNARRVTMFGIPAVLLLSTASMVLPRVPLLVAISAFAVVSIGNRALFPASLAALLLCAGGWDKLIASTEPGRLTRSFFGVYAIDASGGARTITHGTTIHGVQNRGSTAREVMPTSYYAPLSGVGLALGSQAVADHANVSVVGLGAGTLACYARPGQKWTIYEIDPAVVAIASDPSRFTFLFRCLPERKIVVGDARLTLQMAPHGSADVLVIDAFSSDSIPVHLLTREAFQVYRERLADDGLLLVHISNRYLDLVEVVGAEALATGWTASTRFYNPSPAEWALNYKPSLWVALSPSKQKIESLHALRPGIWLPLRRSTIRQWSDDHASVLPIIRL